MKKSALLIVTIFLTGCTIQGGLGYQPKHPRPTHQYGQNIGEIRAEIEKDGLYAACHHVSGLNTAEIDGGLNYCSAGLRVQF